MNYAEIKEFDIANGPGVRISLFVSGCRHHCQNCFNEVAWDFNYGNVFDEAMENFIVEKLNNGFVRGLTLLGGEPLDPQNQTGVLKLLKKVRKACPGKDIWCYTGYVWERDVCGWMSEKCPETKEILSLIDVCVDGPFVESRKNISLQFRGSENQRLIDVPKNVGNREDNPVEGMKMEYVYVAAMVIAFAAVMILGFFLRKKFHRYQPAQDGLEFEVLCTQILTAKGYENVELTPATGDYGVDIFAEKDGVRWAFQCKYYSNPVGVRAVQEIYSGRDFYHCMVGVVMTNSRFTKNAMTLANELNILLWDGAMLDKLFL